MRIVVTGGTGFVGNAVLAAARARKLDAIGLARRAPAASDAVHAADFILCDLLDPVATQCALAGANLVIHAAASPGGSPPWSDSARMFANVLASAKVAGVSRIVLVSSLSVIDYQVVPSGGTIDENSPTLPEDNDRDHYANAKLQQEKLARAHAGEVVIVRPGAIVGPGREWTPRLGARLGGGRWIQIGGESPLPIIDIGSCALAILTAALHRAPPSVVHLVDDSPPTQQEWVDRLIADAKLRAPTLRLRLATVRAIAAATSIFPAALRTRLPGLLVRSRLDARFGAYRFANAGMQVLSREC